MNPTELRLAKRGKGSYTLDGVKVPSVTTILNALPKQLVGWAARETASRAVNEWEELSQLDPIKRYETLKGTPFERRDRAALRGTRIHALGAKVAHGFDVDVPDDLVGPVRAMAKALDRWGIEAVATEAPVANLEHRYAGTLDLVGSVTKLGIARALLDVKTGSGVYESDALQLCAYANADLWQPELGTEEPFEPVEACFVLHVLPDDVELVPIEGAEGSDLLRQFLYVKATWRWLQAIKADPVIGEAMVVEEVAS